MRRALSRMLGGLAKKLDKKSAKTAADGGLPASFERYRDYIKIDPTAIIAPNASLTIFEAPSEPTVMLEIGPGSHIFSTFSLLRESARITIGRDCQLGASQFIAAGRLDIRDDVIMAWGCTIIDTDTHSVDWIERSQDVAKCRRAWVETGGRNISRDHDWSTIPIAPVTIGSKSWIGFNASLLKGTTIGEGSIVGAASVVSGPVPDWTIVAGNPAQEVRRVMPSVAIENRA